MPSLSDTITVKGGRPLKGTIEVHGSKNALPKEMVAALLTAETSTLSNVSRISDVDIVSDMIRAMGGQVEMVDSTMLQITPENIKALDPDELDMYAGKSRIPILLCGPLLNRLGRVVIPSLGGCNIGSRPVDFHLQALEQMGATIIDKGGFITLTASRLQGAKIALEYPSVGATEQVLLSAVLADGVTELSNAAIEPEIMDLICVLQKMGAIISAHEDRRITIEGVDELHGYTHHAIFDRLETASWACVALATDGNIRIEGAEQLPVMTFLNKFRQVGGGFTADETGMTFWREKKKLQSIVLQTDVHPGFMTDWQQPFLLTLTQAEGVSVVHETVYENRFGYTEALNQMGAKIQLYRECLGGKPCRYASLNHKHSAVVVGKTPLKGRELTLPDLRAGFTYVLAGLVAEGETTLHNTKLIQRGYENFLTKLESIGAEFTAS